MSDPSIFVQIEKRSFTLISNIVGVLKKKDKEIFVLVR